jgi:hypothetical protein
MHVAAENFQLPLIVEAAPAIALGDNSKALDLIFFAYSIGAKRIFFVR